MFCREIVYLQERVDGCENVGEKYVLPQRVRAFARVRVSTE